MMSSDPLPPPAPAPDPAPPAPAPTTGKPRGWFSSLFRTHNTDELVVYHHSNLFYWWPIWALGYVFCLITYFGDYHVAVVPDGTEAASDRLVEVRADGETKTEKRDVLILPPGAKLLTKKDANGNVEVAQPVVYMSQYRLLGTVYVIVLLLVIAITNIQVRGLWSVLVVMSLFMLTIIFMAAGWWGAIFRGVGQLSIYINLGAYFLISTVLFVLWVINFYIFDRQTYMIFTPGQVRMRLEIGGGETVYDTSGMVVQKQRSDLFRHWILGFGSGDLHVRPMGLGHALEMPNVMHVGRIVEKIDELVKEKVVVQAESRP